MAHEGVPALWFAHFETQSNPHVLGARAAEAELAREVAAERAGDEEQSLAVFDRRLELAMRARELRRQPRCELIRLEASRQQDRMSPGAAELALQLALAEGGHRAE